MKMNDDGSDISKNYSIKEVSGEETGAIVSP